MNWQGALTPPRRGNEGRLWVELGRSQWIDLSYVFSARMAGSAPHFGRAVCPAVGLSIGAIGLAPQAGAWFGLHVSLALPNSERARLRRTNDTQIR
jgi:hypothetical protein